ncbi:HDOD domain-containing protein [Thalassotalea piscium]
MFMEVTLSIVIFSVLLLIIWRLNHQKKPKTHKHTHLRTNGNVSLKKSTKVVTETKLATDFADESNKEFNVDDIELPEAFSTLTLLNTDPNNSQQKQTIEHICQSFRKPHPLLLPLTQKAFEPNELFDLIKSDPQITAKVLNRVNSPSFALMQPITSINHAIVYLGVGTVKDIAMHFAIENEIDFQSQEHKISYQKLWNASYLASSLGLLFAKELLIEDASDISTQCLLRYLGDMAILSACPEVSSVYQEQQPLYQRVLYCQSQLSINSQLIGSALAQYWQLPRTIARSIDFSLTPLVPTDKNTDETENELYKHHICYIACRIADLVAINEQTCLETIRYDLTKQLDFYYLFKNQQHPIVKKLFDLFYDISFSQKVNSLLLVK